MQTAGSKGKPLGLEINRPRNNLESLRKALMQNSVFLIKSRDADLAAVGLHEGQGMSSGVSSGRSGYW